MFLSVSRKRYRGGLGVFVAHGGRGLVRRVGEGLVGREEFFSFLGIAPGKLP